MPSYVLLKSWESQFQEFRDKKPFGCGAHGEVQNIL
jgi:hypothetical protein